ncbi:hypothetical protein J7K50_09250 [bacterium]|nr:hypothetical protein [bacterium]
MRFAFFLPLLRVDDSGFTFEEFLRNLVNAVKISSPDNYSYPLYKHFFGDNGGSDNGNSSRSDETHKLLENYLHRYKVLPEEAALIKLFKKISIDIDHAYRHPRKLGSVSLSRYLDAFVDFPALKSCLDLVCHYFLHKTTGSVNASDGLVLIDKCFFERSELPFIEHLELLRDECRAGVHAIPALSMNIETELRFRRDRLYCIQFAAERPVQTSNSFFAHFEKKDSMKSLAYVESFLSADEAEFHGVDPSGWVDLRNEMKNMFDARFTNARTEVSMT